jgi:uncharacterized phage protein gp47/JayE
LSLGDYLETYTFEYLINSALSRVPDTIDKREGSIIYDALSPACFELAEYYMRLKEILQNTFISTCNGDYLDYRCAEKGLTRYVATNSIRKGTFVASGSPATIPTGSRFSANLNGVNLVYVATELIVAGQYKMQCEAVGTVGNDYIGDIIPISAMGTLDTATITDILTPARDVETDEELRTRYLVQVNQSAFGGNIANYDEALKDIGGVGEVQIYPTWNGGGTVKCSIIDSSYNVCTAPFIADVQELIDPQALSGTGLGIAPIGHTVTITTPDEVTVNIVTTITLEGGYTVGQVETPINDAIESYFLELRQKWGLANDLNEYNLSVYKAKINAAILGITGVANVEDTTLNGLTIDITLTENATTQQLPILGSVTLNV